MLGKDGKKMRGDVRYAGHHARMCMVRLRATEYVNSIISLARRANRASPARGFQKKQREMNHSSVEGEWCSCSGIKYHIYES